MQKIPQQTTIIQLSRSQLGILDGLIDTNLKSHPDCLLGSRLDLLKELCDKLYDALQFCPPVQLSQSQFTFLNALVTQALQSHETSEVKGDFWHHHALASIRGSMMESFNDCQFQFPSIETFKNKGVFL